MLHLLGIDHNRLTVKYQGLDMKLTGVEPSRVVKEVLAKRVLKAALASGNFAIIKGRSKTTRARPSSPPENLIHKPISGSNR